MKKIILLTFAIFVLTSCGDKEVSGPASQPEIKYVSKGYVLTDQDRIDLATKLKVIYWCDFPNDMPGPPAPGHCRENGEDCTPLPEPEPTNP